MVWKFPTCHLVVSRLSCKCGIPIVSKFVPDVLSRFSPSCLPLNPHNAQLSSRFCHPIIYLISFQLFPSCLPDVVFQLSSNFIPLALSLKPSLLLGCEAGLIVSGSPDVSLYWSLFICLLVWLSTASGVRLSLVSCRHLEDMEWETPSGCSRMTSHYFTLHYIAFV